ncbi:hypothetical protein ALC57_02333, partial [Trachymyrmex cornetzi]
TSLIIRVVHDSRSALIGDSLPRNCDFSFYNELLSGLHSGAGELFELMHLILSYKPTMFTVHSQSLFPITRIKRYVANS